MEQTANSLYETSLHGNMVAVLINTNIQYKMMNNITTIPYKCISYKELRIVALYRLRWPEKEGISQPAIVSSLR